MSYNKNFLFCELCECVGHEITKCPLLKENVCDSVVPPVFEECFVPAAKMCSAPAAKKPTPVAPVTEMCFISVAEDFSDQAPRNRPSRPGSSASVAKEPASVAKKPASVAKKPASVAKKPASVAKKPASVAKEPASVACSRSFKCSDFVAGNLSDNKSERDSKDDEPACSESGNNFEAAKKLTVSSSKKIFAGIILVDVRGRILLQNSRDRRCPGLPGGGFEFKDDSLFDAAVRETFEETGLNVLGGGYSFVYEFPIVMDFPYGCTVNFVIRTDARKWINTGTTSYEVTDYSRGDKACFGHSWFSFEDALEQVRSVKNITEILQVYKIQSDNQ
jgi:8-oxo-dGTP pyrophosphatase MutT (NUDIX family)